MKIYRTEIECPICKTKYTASELMSMYIGNSYLDGQPLYRDLTFGINECPNCHYVSNGIDTPVNDKIKEIVNSEEYQKEALDENHEYFLLNSMYRLHHQCAERLFWYKRTNNLECKDLLKEVLKRKRNIIRERKYSDSAELKYADLLRQNGNFLKSKIVLTISSLAARDHIKEAIAFEKQLIKNKDTAPHLWNEVQKNKH